MSNDLLATGSVLVPLDRIPTDEAAQTRVKPRAGVVRDYAAAMTEQLADGGLRFPPVVLFTDGTAYWLGDGYHRILAARKAGLTDIAAEVRSGSRRDALLFGISANNTHGLPRTNADKRKAVALLLGDPEWSQWSDREIAKRCQVGHALVSRLRRSASVSGRQMARNVERNGTVYEMNVKGSANAKQDSAAVTDPLGIPLPESRANVFMALVDFQEAKELIDSLAGLLDRIAHGPAGELYRQDMIRMPDNQGYACAGLRQCRNKLLAGEPYCCYCPLCHGAHAAHPRPTCKTCGGRGWTTRHAFEACGPGDREYILKMR